MGRPWLEFQPDYPVRRLIIYRTDITYLPALVHALMIAGGFDWFQPARPLGWQRIPK
jgi:hypothetical protein